MSWGLYFFQATDATVKLTDLVNKAGKEVKTKTQKTKPSPTSVPASQECLKVEHLVIWEAACPFLLSLRRLLWPRPSLNS